MSALFTHSFKIQAVEKALNRKRDISIKDVAETLGVGYSTLQKWIRQTRDQQLNPESENSMSTTAKEKRPQDWNTEERLNMIIACGSLSDEGMNQLCREKGIYPHHIKQWRSDFIKGSGAFTPSKSQSESKKFKQEIKLLQKELNRKDKALAETAALLVLQKKVNTIWGNDEGSSL